MQRLAEAEAARADLDVYARSVVQHTADGVAGDINWLDTLIASERAALATSATSGPSVTSAAAPSATSVTAGTEPVA